MGRLKTLQPKLAELGSQAKARGWADTRQTSSSERGYGWAWQQAVKRIRARDCDVCQECVRTQAMPIGTYAAVDHRTPRWQGGSDDDENLEVICKHHHDLKTAAESARARADGSPIAGPVRRP